MSHVPFIGCIRSIGTTLPFPFSVRGRCNKLVLFSKMKRVETERKDNKLSQPSESRREKSICRHLNVEKERQLNLPPLKKTWVGLR